MVYGVALRGGDRTFVARFFLNLNRYFVLSTADDQAITLGTSLRSQKRLLQDRTEMEGSIDDSVGIDLGEPGYSDINHGEGWEEIDRICWVCFECLERDGVGLTHIRSPLQTLETTGSFYCKCTLRSRCLNRWLCVPCYQEEAKVDAARIDQQHWGLYSSE